MQDFLLEQYLWIKAFHIISVICWMAVLLYAPRLFVYHCDAEKGSDKSETFKIMERKLVRYIGNPASIFTWIFGGLMFWATPELFSEPWMHTKLTGIILITGAYHAITANMKKFQKDENKRSQKYYKILNEIPTVLMIFIVIMAVAKPF